MAKEYPKSMTDEMLNVVELRGKLPEGGWNTIAGASTYVMFLDEADNTMIRVFFDVDSMNRSYDLVKYSTQTKVSFELVAESGLVLNFDAICTTVGRNNAIFKVKRKDISELI